MRLIMLTPKEGRDGRQPPQVSSYICEDCAADFGIIIPRSIENVEILQLICSTDGAGNLETRKCAHPQHASRTAKARN